MELVLASGSPRRATLLKLLGWPFRVEVSGVTETNPFSPWSEWVQEMACLKAESVALSPLAIVLAADTIVVKEGKVLGKPANEAEAREMLAFLAKGVHQVLTGICVRRGQQVWQDVAKTKVYFRALDKQEIAFYLASGEAFDKAGAYGIQGLGSLFIEKIEGCYYNVVGLPLVKTMNLLRKAGLPILGQ